VNLHLNSSPVNVRSPIKLPPLPKEPLLSIVITSYTVKRLEDICELLNRLNKQTYSNIEIIIVIEKSKVLYEELKAYISRYNNDLSQKTRLIFSQDELGISEARNLGVKNSHGDVIAFIDDDALPSYTWSAEIVKTFIMNNNANIIGVAGPVLPFFKDKTLTWFPKEFYWIIGCTGWKNLKQWQDVETTWGPNMAFRKEAFDFVYFKSRYTRGAHEKGKMGPVGDDREFSLTVRRTTRMHIIYNPGMKVWHKVDAYKLNSKYIRRYSFWQGYSDAMFKHILKVSHERLKSEYNILLSIISNLLPSMMRELVENHQAAFKKLRVLVETLVYFSIGYISYLIPGLIHITKNLV
jgi:glycosyltransferase involved in cell wall biosynthesis